MSEKKLNIALLVGGTSPERQVSKNTGASIFKALKSLDYNVKAYDPAYGLHQPEDINLLFEEIDYTNISNENYLQFFASDMLNGVDLVFIGLHGKYGEDGIIQSMLELKDLKYTGSKVLSSSLSMDKLMSKIMFRESNISTPKWTHAELGKYDIDVILEEIRLNLNYPCVIKPNDQGSTVGLTICKTEDEVANAINQALQFSNIALIEEYIPGYEMTVAVIEGHPLPVLEIKPKHDLYDYECKYTSGMSEYIVPAEISDEVKAELQSQAILAFNALGCNGYARVDFRVSKDYKPYCLEINTLPGMTSTSLVPKMAKADGITFEQLIQKIITLSL